MRWLSRSPDPSGRPPLLTFSGRRFIAGLAVGTAAVLLPAAGTIAWLYPQLPTLDKVEHYEPRQPLEVYTRDGVEVATFGPERRHYLPIGQIPLLMQQAVIAVEDARFRDHAGIDLRGILRAAVADLSGGMPQGASTITQQVARTFFLSPRRTAERKLKEALLALEIENRLSKDEILELYMNQIFLGHRAYGFAAAADAYFGKRLDELSIAETAMLAGLPQNPGYANPITNPERARQRQAIVLQRMRATNVIDDAQLAAALAEKLQVRATSWPAIHAEYVAEMARQAIYARYGEAGYVQGLKVYTSLVASDQEAAYHALRRGVLDYERRHPYRGPEDHEKLPTDTVDDASAAAEALRDHRDDEDLRIAIVTEASPRELVARLASGDVVRLTGDALRWVQPALAARASPDLAIVRGSIIRLVRTDRGRDDADLAHASWAIGQWPDADAGFVSLDPESGRVRALVGGFSYADNRFNHVLQAWRQPGSSFKPFLYSAALEHGVMPSTIINDAPLVDDAASGAPNGWNPKDDDGTFEGPMTMRDALAKSKNLVSIRIVQNVGVEAARQWAGRFGFDIDKQPDNLTLALGTGSTTPLQLAGAYAVFANGGYRVAPVVIERIVDAQGQVLYEAPPPAPLDDANRVIPARNAFVMESLLQQVTRSGTAARAQQTLKRPDLYGKTGTTNDAVDAWFAGFQPGVVGVAWMGYDQPESLGTHESGGGVALPIWIDYMQQALKGVPVVPLKPPDGVVQRDGDWAYNDAPEAAPPEPSAASAVPVAVAASGIVP
ncbi:MAG: PBP1A family penicillin-binding protein [Proteobacteria bacterium]|nr:PBP1A family penicillin-binding protein [Pseudomonadota bacterium]